MHATLLETLDHLEIGARVSYGPLHLFPLCGGACAAVGIVVRGPVSKGGAFSLVFFVARAQQVGRPYA